MTLNIPRYKVVFFLLALLTIFLGALSIYFLPERFLSDAILIIEDFYNEKGYLGSYPLTMTFYDNTGLGKLPFPIIAIIQLTILLGIIYKLGIPERFAKFTLRNLLVYSSILLLVFYISMPSKEFITFIFIAVIAFLLKNKRFSVISTVVLIFGLLFIFGFLYRPYYVLVPFIAGVIYLTSLINFKRKALAGIFYGLLIMIFISLSYGIIKGEYLSQNTREKLNEERLGREATNTALASPVETDTWYGETVGILYGFVSINVPVNAFKHLLRPQILAFVFWQLVLTLYLLYLYRNCLKQRRENIYAIWSFYLVFAYFIIQGVFEPDLGSAVRHKIGILPLIYFALYYDSFRKNIPV